MYCILFQKKRKYKESKFSDDFEHTRHSHYTCIVTLKYFLFSPDDFTAK